jgi:hypothetical protein
MRAAHIQGGSAVVASTPQVQQTYNFRDGRIELFYMIESNAEG